jgi:hypothetical protein
MATTKLSAGGVAHIKPSLTATVVVNEVIVMDSQK